MTAGAAHGLGERVVAPFGRRLCDVTRNLPSGGYRIFSALDPAGPEPAAGQFYMLAADSGWGGDEGRPYLARAFSVADAEKQQGGVRLDFLVQAVGPGTSPAPSPQCHEPSPAPVTSIRTERPERSWPASASAQGSMRTPRSIVR